MPLRVDLIQKMEHQVIANKLADMAELDQLRALAANNSAINTENFGKQIQLLAIRDRHVARARAFIDAARMILAE